MGEFLKKIFLKRIFEIISKEVPVKKSEGISGENCKKLQWIVALRRISKRIPAGVSEVTHCYLPKRIVGEISGQIHQGITLGRSSKNFQRIPGRFLDKNRSKSLWNKHWKDWRPNPWSSFWRNYWLNFVWNP